MKFTFTDFSIVNKQVEALEAYLKKAHEQFIRTTVIFEAQNYASKNLPAAQDENMESYLTAIRGFYGKLKKEISIRIQGGVQRTLGAVNVATANQHIETKEVAIREETEKLNRWTVDRGRIFADGDQESYKKQRKLLMILGAFDCLWTMSAFLKLGDIMLIAMGIGIGIGIAQTSVVINATQIIREFEDIKKRRVYIIIAIASAVVFSGLLAALRYWFIHMGSGASVPYIIMNPFTFIAINLLFIAATALIVYFQFPTKAQNKEMSKAKRLDKEIQKAADRREQLNEDLTKLRKEREFFIELRTRLTHAETKLHEKVNKLFDEAVGAFKHENTMKRSDNIFPQSFKNPYIPLADESIEGSNFLEN